MNDTGPEKEDAKTSGPRVCQHRCSQICLQKPDIHSYHSVFFVRMCESIFKVTPSQKMPILFLCDSTLWAQDLSPHHNESSYTCGRTCPCFCLFVLKIFFWCGPFLKSLLNLLQYCFCFMFWAFGCEACGILAHPPGIKPTPHELDSKVLTTGPPGKFQNRWIFCCHIIHSEISWL